MPTHFVMPSYFVCPHCNYQHQIYRDVPVLCCRVITYFKDVYPLQEAGRVYVAQEPPADPPARLDFDYEKVWSTYPEALGHPSAYVGADPAVDDGAERPQPEAPDPSPADPSAG